MQLSSNLTASVRSILERDSSAVQTLIELLLEERSALQTRDTAQLNDAVARKLECLKRMEQQERERKVLVKQTRSRDWPELITAVDADGSPGLTATWEKLLQRLREVAELTEINARIVTRTRRSTERLLAILRGQTEPVGIYDKLGRTQAYGDNRAITSA